MAQILLRPPGADPANQTPQDGATYAQELCHNEVLELENLPIVFWNEGNGEDHADAGTRNQGAKAPRDVRQVILGDPQLHMNVE